MYELYKGIFSVFRSSVFIVFSGAHHAVLLIAISNVQKFTIILINQDKIINKKRRCQ